MVPFLGEVGDIIAIDENASSGNNKLGCLSRFSIEVFSIAVFLLRSFLWNHYLQLSESLVGR